MSQNHLVYCLNIFDKKKIKSPPPLPSSPSTVWGLSLRFWAVHLDPDYVVFTVSVNFIQDNHMAVLVLKNVYLIAYTYHELIPNKLWTSLIGTITMFSPAYFLHEALLVANILRTKYPRKHGLICPQKCLILLS